jgi:hypothetical protein
MLPPDRATARATRARGDNLISARMFQDPEGGFAGKMR